MCNKHALGNTSWQTFIASRVEEPDGLLARNLSEQGNMRKTSREHQEKPDQYEIKCSNWLRKQD